MATKKKSRKRSTIPTIPQLSFQVLNNVQTIEKYAHNELRDCRDVKSGDLNVEKAKRIARTCSVAVLDVMLAYYESLVTFDERWIIQLQESAVESVVGMIPSGYEDDLYEFFRHLLWKTTYSHLNAPKANKKLEPVSKQATLLKETIADQINHLRKECHLSTEELADKIGIDTRSVKRHVAGKSTPYPQHLRAYQKIFSELLNRQISIRA